MLELLTGDLRPAMFTAVRRCRDAGLTTGLLTNNVAPMQEGGWSHELALDELFDVVVESAVAGVRKPEVAAYELVLRKMRLPAEQVVFLDDLGVNLKPAQGDGHDHHQGDRPRRRPRRARDRAGDQPALRSRAWDRIIACSWSWTALEPVAGLPDSKRLTRLMANRSPRAS